MKVICNNISDLIELNNSGYLEANTLITFEVYSPIYLNLNIVTKGQLKRLIDSGCLQVFTGQDIFYDEVLKYFKKYGFGFRNEEYVNIIKCLKSNCYLMSNDIAILKICQKENLKTLGLKNVTELIIDNDFYLDEEFKEQNKLKIKKSGN